MGTGAQRCKIVRVLPYKNIMRFVVYIKEELKQNSTRGASNRGQYRNGVLPNSSELKTRLNKKAVPGFLTCQEESNDPFLTRVT